jgi:hypothetical protein
MLCPSEDLGAMATVVLLCGHASSAIRMPTLEYQRGHGTPKKGFDKHQE